MVSYHLYSDLFSSIVQVPHSNEVPVILHPNQGQPSSEESSKSEDDEVVDP